VIEIQDLYKYYGERRAVGPLSFTIEPGEVVGLVGRNGAGKTTTLRILACDLLPSSGSVRVDGVDVVERPDEVRKKIGYLPDTPPLYGEMTVRAYLGFAASLRGSGRAEVARRVGDVAAKTQIDRVLDEPIASLSHGFKQRVGIAQAMVHDPRLLVLDEPISGLDPLQIKEMRELLRSLRGAHTILISSHILSEVSETCDRILFVNDGALLHSGTPAEMAARLGKQRAEILVANKKDEAERILLDLPGVTRVEVGPPPRNERALATLRVESSRDLRPDLCRALVSGGIDVLEVRRASRELENLFESLAGGSKTADEAGDAEGGAA
jgi:ABC-2 type transport system ATP-binding protein